MVSAIAPSLALEAPTEPGNPEDYTLNTAAATPIYYGIQVILTN